MSIGVLRGAVAGYLQIAPNELIVNNVDLSLIAFNNARKTAERYRDWNCQEIIATGIAVNGKGSWASMTDLETDLSVRLKQPQSFYRQQSDGLLVPMRHSSRKTGVVKALEYRDANTIYDAARRYPGDIVQTEFPFLSNTPSSEFEVLMYGSGKYELFPTPTENITVVVDGHRWLDNYTGDDDTDFFVEDGFDYMMYAAIVELNLRFQTFIPQQEGNLSPPEKARDNALASLQEHDDFIVESGRLPNV